MLDRGFYILRKGAELRNYAKYGNKVGETITQQLNSGKSYEQIIQGAGKTNVNLNKLLGN